MGPVCSTESKKKNNSKLLLDEQKYIFKNRFNTEIRPSAPPENKLYFEININSVKATNLTDDYYFCKIVIYSNTNQYFLPLTQGPNPKFKFESDISLEIDFEELEKNYFTLYLYALPKYFDVMSLRSFEDLVKTTSYRSKISIDILTLAIGPEHHDIILYDRIKNEYSGRMQFIITCQHMEHINISLNSFKAVLNKEVHNDLSFYLKLKGVSEIDVFESDPTEPLKPNVDKKKNLSEYTYSSKSLQKNNLIIEDLFFSFNELRLSTLSVKILDTRMGYEEEDKDNLNGSWKKKLHKSQKFDPNRQNLGNTYVNLMKKYQEIGVSQVNFFKILSQNDDQVTKQESRVFQIIAPLYKKKISESVKSNISFNNIHNPGLTKELKFSIFENIKKIFKEGIYHNGVLIGQIEGEIKVTGLPLIRQIICGTHTEKGLDFCSNFLSIRRVDNLVENKLPPEVDIVQSEGERLLNKLTDFTSLSQFTEEFHLMKKEITLLLTNILKALEKSNKENSLFFHYENDIQLIRSQEIILNLGKELLEIVDDFNSDHRNICLNILVRIYERGEFDLPLMSVYQGDKNEEKIKMKVNVALLLIELLVKSLKFSLVKISKSYTDESTKLFVEHFLSIAYFRIPEFRKVFLECISHDLSSLDDNMFENMVKEKENIEGIGIERNLNREFEKSEFSMDKINTNPVVLLVDWDKVFYSRIFTLAPSELEELNKSLEAILTKADWKARIKKKGLIFFSMIRKLENYIQGKLEVERDIIWTHIPGFKIIIQSITHELRIREIFKYNKILIEVMKTFINDHNIMNMFCSIIFSKTNVYEAASVFNTFTILDSLFQEYSIKQHISSFNIKFNYYLLDKSFEILMSTDNSLSLAKFLWFYYRNSFNVSIEHLMDFFKNLIEVHFYRLFFHWSFQVRNVFYHYLIFIVNFRIKNNEFHSLKKKSLELSDRKMKANRKQSVNGYGISNYHDKSKEKILDVFSQKMSFIEKLRNIINDNKNSSFKFFESMEDNEISNILSNEMLKYIVIGISHYQEVEALFSKWEYETQNKSEKEIYLPQINLQNPKDDYVEYQESW